MPLSSSYYQMWHYFFPQNTPAVLLNNPLNIFFLKLLKSVTRWPDCLWPEMLHICVEGQIGLRDWQSVRVWPPSRGRLADLLVTTDTSLGSWWCHSRPGGKPSCCYDPCRGSSHSLHSSFDDTGFECLPVTCNSN